MKSIHNESKGLKIWCDYDVVNAGKWCMISLYVKTMDSVEYYQM